MYTLLQLSHSPLLFLVAAAVVVALGVVVVVAFCVWTTVYYVPIES